MSATGHLYLIPSPLTADNTDAIHSSSLAAIRQCQVFFVENERTTRRYFKQLWKEMEIDQYEWVTIHKAEEEVLSVFRDRIQSGKNIGIVSEAGCPGIADPGQRLIALAQEMNYRVIPLVGPNSILLALMASGMNGQAFEFHGYLPIPDSDRQRKLRELESKSAKDGSTQIFIETPYRNNQLVEAILKSCRPTTRLCIAVDITGGEEWIRTRTLNGWKKDRPDIHKRPAIFLISA